MRNIRESAPIGAKKPRSGDKMLAHGEESIGLETMGNSDSIKNSTP